MSTTTSHLTDIIADLRRHTRSIRSALLSPSSPGRPPLSINACASSALSAFQVIPATRSSPCILYYPATPLRGNPSWRWHHRSALTALYPSSTFPSPPFSHRPSAPPEQALEPSDASTSPLSWDRWAKGYGRYLLRALPYVLLIALFAFLRFAGQLLSRSGPSTRSLETLLTLVVVGATLYTFSASFSDGLQYTATPPPALQAFADSIAASYAFDRTLQTAAYLEALPFRPPLRDYHLTSPYGTRIDPISGTPSFHSGVDLAVPVGTLVYAPGRGTVVEVGFDEGFGNYVLVEHHPTDYTTLLGHLRRASVHVGDPVGPERPLGESGSTGRSTGPHLHFQVYGPRGAVNPSILYEQSRSLRALLERLHTPLDSVLQSHTGRLPNALSYDAFLYRRSFRVLRDSLAPARRLIYDYRSTSSPPTASRPVPTSQPPKQPLADHTGSHSKSDLQVPSSVSDSRHDIVVPWAPRPLTSHGRSDRGVAPHSALRDSVSRFSPFLDTIAVGAVSTMRMSPFSPADSASTSRFPRRRRPAPAPPVIEGPPPIAPPPFSEIP
jgi:murein DD-endopeptidase MepM/ murein hydrolase activator NlpD